MKSITIFLLDTYKLVFSPVLISLFGKSCKYETDCSTFARQMVEKHGTKKGMVLGFRRLASCHNY